LRNIRGLYRHTSGQLYMLQTSTRPNRFSVTKETAKAGLSRIHHNPRTPLLPRVGKSETPSSPLRSRCTRTSLRHITAPRRCRSPSPATTCRRCSTVRTPYRAAWELVLFPLRRPCGKEVQGEGEYQALERRRRSKPCVARLRLFYCANHRLGESLDGSSRRLHKK
jgi:hypothetical protein